MALNLYMDHHVHSYVTAYLRDHDIDCITAEEDGHADEPDHVILERATSLGRIVVTYDKDFFVLHTETLRRRSNHAGILHVRSKGTSPKEVLESLLLSAISHQPPEMVDVLERHPL